MNSISKKKIYIFDANVFINLHRIDMHSIRLPDEVWVKLDELMMDGKIISHRTVYDEVVSGSKNPDKISAWLRSRKDYFEKSTARQIEIMAEVINKFPKLIDVNTERDQADPWLVALAAEKIEQNTTYEYIVVTQENQASSIKLPAACKEFGVHSIPLAEFFEENDITFGVSFG
jgi:hypothetical protein